jgi:hypothetical protein
MNAAVIEGGVASSFAENALSAATGKPARWHGAPDP